MWGCTFLSATKSGASELPPAHSPTHSLCRSCLWWGPIAGSAAAPLGVRGTLPCLDERCFEPSWTPDCCLETHPPPQ
ncbi:hypothetical protein WJX72_007138 [[Myrmecia] bisecta]|uniref:Secreted protein n=1 Tax=[Myrmecia] bisecta TaxID=41462 RepID=A0AAW1Q477_9CHLO